MVVSKRKRKKLKKYFKLMVIVILGLLIVINGYKLINSVFSKDNNVQEEVPQRKYIQQESVYPSEVYGVPVYTDLIPENTISRTGTKRIIKYIVIHETDNFSKGVGAHNHAIYLKNNNTSSTSWHYTVDDKEIYHHVPDDEIANHAGTKNGNEFGIGIELCVNADGNFESTFNNAAKLVAYLIKSYNLDISDIKTHHDFSGKDCPHSILKEKRFSEFIEKVKNFMN